MAKKSDTEHLQEIWEGRARIKANYSSERQRQRDVQIELQDLAFALHRDNYYWAAEAIASFLLGKTKSLDEAFGLIQSGRGRPPSRATCKRDARVLKAWLDDKPYPEISSEMKMLELDVKRLCEGTTEAFMRRRDAAYAEILRESLEKKD